MLKRFIHFLRHELWSEPLHRMRFWKRLGVGTLRVGAHTYGSFDQNLGSIRAAGMSLITLMSLVPLLALVFGIGTGLGYRKELDQAMQQLSADWPAELQRLVVQLQDLVARTNFRALGVMGTLFLAYTGYSLFTNVENALNQVWRTTHARRWYRRITDFIALIIIVPLFALSALFLSSVLESAAFLEALEREAAWAAVLYNAGLGFVPHVMMWIAFTALFKIMPSADVHWRSAMIAGILTGSAWVLLYRYYIYAQVSVARQNAIYGTFAALPLLLIYLQVTWMVILLGAEVSYAIQNLHVLRTTQHTKEHLLPPSYGVTVRLGLMIVERATAKFVAGEGGYDLAELARALDVPKGWVDRVFDDLQAAKILMRVGGEDSELVIPARPPDKITMYELVRAVRGTASSRLLERVKLSEDLEARLLEMDRAVSSVLQQRTFS